MISLYTDAKEEGAGSRSWEANVMIIANSSDITKIVFIGLIAKPRAKNSRQHPLYLSP